MISITIANTNKTIKGQVPLRISPSWESGEIPKIMYRLSPTGGVMHDSSRFTTIIIANHTGSIFNASIIGNIMGKVIRMMAAGSKKSPMKIKMQLMRIINPIGPKPRSITAFAIL
jgi:hypothetical protein